MVSIGSKEGSFMPSSYKPRAGRVAPRPTSLNASAAEPTGQATSQQSEEKAKLIPCGGGWKTNWGYSCQVTLNGMSYKVMAFWNNKPKGSNPPAINFTIRETDMEGTEAPVREEYNG
tara:strand:- start:13839 stop:14189 length:351 start_codon:yes stop_codon:yes gene_type:complete